MHGRISRRQFLKVCLSGLAALAGSSWLGRLVFAQPGASNARPKKAIRTEYDLIVARGQDPYLLTRKAIDAIGGMGRFVKKGDVVVIKPNIGWDRQPEYAACTNPSVVAALVALCFEAGAKRVNVFDITCNSAQRCYENSGIKKAAQEKGASVYFADDWNFIKARFGYESPMEGWPIFRDAIECDTFINVPVLKQHSLTGLTASMKNLMGVCGGNRGQMHNAIGPKLADLTDFINPELTVIDAYRVLAANGPSGGDLKDVVLKKTVMVSADPTLADVYACGLMGIEPKDVPSIASAIDRKFGRSDVNGARVLSLDV